MAKNLNAVSFSVGPLPHFEDKRSEKPDIGREAHLALLNQYAPPSVISDEKGNILYIHGRTGRFLEPAPGKASMNIIEMARSGLKMELSSAIREVATTGKEIRIRDLLVKNNGDMEKINLFVSSLNKTDNDSNMLMIVFEETKSVDSSVPKEKATSGGKKKDKKVSSLREELQQTKHHLQMTIEELETANEELKSTNEELQSVNEELQSTNEELETSKEEQQSMNEELTTVNAELRNKIDELTTANNDMKNLLDSIEIPTIFLDNNLCISRFTSHAQKVIKLIPSDLGRPIGDIATRVSNINIAEDAEKVMDTLVYTEQEVLSDDGVYYNLRIAPYRTYENVIEGVVITFVKLTRIKETELKLVRLATILNDSNDAITLQNLDGDILSWNKGAERLYGYTEKQATKMNILELIPQSRQNETKQFMKKLRSGKLTTPLKTERIKKNGDIAKIWLTVTPVTVQGNIVQIATIERDLDWLSDS